MEWTKAEIDSELQGRAQNAAEQAMAQAINAADKATRSAGVKGVKDQALSTLLAEYPERGREVSNHLEDIEYRVMRKQVLERGERVDGRDLDTIRPISIETGVLPRTHGSALFTRARPRPSSRSPSAPPTTSSGSTASTWPARRPSRSCCTTTSRPTPRAR